MTNIIINENTINYILKNGGSVTIESIKSGCGWVSVPLPKVMLGEPTEKSSFDLYEKDSVNIYVSQRLILKGDSIRIQLNSFLGIFNNLDVSGFEIFR